MATAATPPARSGESETHRRLKAEACRWLFASGYAAVAAEVRLRPLGVIDAVGSGLLPARRNHLDAPRPLHQVCFIECKASRSDFLRDHSRDGQMLLSLLERDANRRRRRRPLAQSVGLGKFLACLAQPLANLHYVLAPAGLLQKRDLPPRWGLLALGAGGVSVVVRAAWQEGAAAGLVESAIARTLTADLHRADRRAAMSVNRRLMQEQQRIARDLLALQFSPPPAPAGSAPAAPPGSAPTTP